MVWPMRRLRLALLPLLLAACGLVAEESWRYEADFPSATAQEGVLFLFPEPLFLPEGTYGLSLEAQGSFSGGFAVVLPGVGVPEECALEASGGAYGFFCPAPQPPATPLALYLEGVPKGLDLTPHLAELAQGARVGVWVPKGASFGGSVRLTLRAQRAAL